MLKKINCTNNNEIFEELIENVRKISEFNVLLEDDVLEINFEDIDFE